MINDILNIFQGFMGNDLKFEIFQIGQRFLVGGKFHALDELNIENIDIQSPAGGDFGIQLPQRAGSCVSGIGKEGFSLRFLPFIQLVEALLRHKHLTPDDQSGGRVFDGHGN